MTGGLVHHGAHPVRVSHEERRSPTTGSTGNSAPSTLAGSSSLTGALLPRRAPVPRRSYMWGDSWMSALISPGWLRADGAPQQRVAHELRRSSTTGSSEVPALYRHGYLPKDGALRSRVARLLRRSLVAGGSCRLALMHCGCLFAFGAHRSRGAVVIRRSWPYSSSSSRRVRSRSMSMRTKAAVSPPWATTHCFRSSVIWIWTCACRPWSLRPRRVFGGTVIVSI
jgi:hypothetical protein